MAVAFVRNALMMTLMMMTMNYADDKVKASAQRDADDHDDDVNGGCD